MHSQRHKLATLHKSTLGAAGPRVTIGEVGAVNRPSTTVAQVVVGRVGRNTMVPTTKGPEVAIPAMAGTAAGAGVEVGANGKVSRERGR